jgi:transposase
MTLDLIEAAHHRQWQGEKLCHIADQYGVPCGTLRRALHHYRQDRDLRGPFQVRAEIAERAIRKGDTPDEVAIYMRLHYGLCYSFDAVYKVMRRLGWEGRATKNTLNLTN